MSHHQLTLTIQLGNDAMQTADDIAEALRRSAERVELGLEKSPIWDANGNRVGDWWIS